MSMGCGCDEFHWRRLVNRRHLLDGDAGLAALDLHLPADRFAVRARAQEGTAAASPTPERLPIEIIGGHGALANGSYISPLVELHGDIEVGRRCFVASHSVLVAEEGRRVSLGDENNCQDNAYLLARGQNLVFGDMVSIAHQAAIENSVVGTFTFFGFRSRTRNCEVGAGAMIMHNTTVENVVIPPNRITPVGVRISEQAQADALDEVTEVNEAFKRGVRDVNLELADNYARLDERLGRSGLSAIGPNPATSWNPESIEPQIGAGTFLAEWVRIVGDVRLGAESSVGQRTAIRADEGTPIVIGRRARIQSGVTFHALKGTNIAVGDNARIGNGNVIHGPVRIGDNFVSEDGCVVFRATVEDNVTVRAGATIAGDCIIREGSIVPAGSVVTTQAEADALPIR